MLKNHGGSPHQSFLTDSEMREPTQYTCPVLTPRRQHLDATSLCLRFWTKLQRPLHSYPNLTALCESPSTSPSPSPRSSQDSATLRRHPQAEVPSLRQQRNTQPSARLPIEPLIPLKGRAGSKEEPEPAPK